MTACLIARTTVPPQSCIASKPLRAHYLSKPKDDYLHSDTSLPCHPNQSSAQGKRMITKSVSWSTPLPLALRNVRLALGCANINAIA